MYVNMCKTSSRIPLLTWPFNTDKPTSIHYKIVSTHTRGKATHCNAYCYDTWTYIVHYCVLLERSTE